MNFYNNQPSCFTKLIAISVAMLILLITSMHSACAQRFAPIPFIKDHEESLTPAEEMIFHINRIKTLADEMVSLFLDIEERQVAFSPEEPKQFEFAIKMKQFSPVPYIYVWSKQSPTTWLEKDYHSGVEFYYKRLRRAYIDGSRGVILKKDAGLEIFVPDKGSPHMWLRQRELSGDNIWRDYYPMNNVE